jgi:RNA polymerase sigma factor (sigma-70 family)
VSDDHTLARFEQTALTHLAVAYNLARWLTRNDHSAEDVVQEAYARAFRSFGGFHDGDGRAWLLAIVRHTAYSWLQSSHGHELMMALDEDLHSVDGGTENPETFLLHRANQQLVREALEELPVEFREVIVLRELEEQSYKEIAHTTALPLGTVMSRLARARKRLQQSLTRRLHTEV